MKPVCRHCGEEFLAPAPPPATCPHCGCNDWPLFYLMEKRDATVLRLKLAIRDILKLNPYAGIGKTPEGRHLALLPMLCNRWLANPALYGEFLGTVNDVEQIEAMLFGFDGVEVHKTRASSSRLDLV